MLAFSLSADAILKYFNAFSAFLLLLFQLIVLANNDAAAILNCDDSLSANSLKYLPATPLSYIEYFSLIKIFPIWSLALSESFLSLTFAISDRSSITK